MYVCSNHLLDFLLKQNNPGVPAVVTNASCQPGYHSHPGLTCHPTEQGHNDNIKMQLGGLPNYYRLHPKEYVKAMQSGAFQNQQVRCPAGEHTHPGGERCHTAQGRHRKNAIASMGGETSYYRLHPHAKPQKEEGTGRTRRTGEELDEAKREAAGWKDAKTTAKEEGLEVQPLSSKLKKIDEGRALSTPLIRKLKGKSPKQREAIIKELVPKKWRDAETTVVNSALLKGDDTKGLLETNWLVRWNTEYKGTVNQNTVYSAHHHATANKAKWGRMRQLARDLPKFKRLATNHAQAPDPTSPSSQHGAALLLLMQSGFRPGGKRYAEENGSFGITSLRRGDVKILSGDKVRLTFVGKKQQQFNHVVNVGKVCHSYLKKSLAEKGNPEDKLFSRVSDSTMRGYVAQFNPDLVPKDFRTLSVNKEIFKMMKNMDTSALNETWERDLAAKRIVDAVAKRHGHTPDAAIRNYVHPLVLKAFIDGHKLPRWQGIAKMLYKQGEYLDALDEDERDFAMYLAGIHVV